MATMGVEEKSAVTPTVHVVGKYYLGDTAILLKADVEENGGSFVRECDDNGYVSVVVGLNTKSWGRGIGYLVHELTELASRDVRGCYSRIPDYALASDGYLFVMDHEQFSEVTMRVGLMLSECLPKLAEAYRAHGPPSMVHADDRTIAT